MKSFPSTFKKNNLVQTTGLTSTNLRQTIKNIGNQLINNSLGGGTIEEKNALGANIDWREYNFKDSISSIPYTNNSNLKDSSVRLFNKDSSNQVIYENANKIPALTLAAINKYRIVYNTSAIQIGPEGKKDAKDKALYADVAQEGISPSLFNPWFGVRMQGFTINSPLMVLKNAPEVSVNFNGIDGNETSLDTTQPRNIKLDNMDGDFTDCSIRTLVGLNKGKQSDGDRKNMGPGGFYRYADFMYCKDLGKVSNNHLITLRRFTHPIGDNIFKYTAGGEMLPDKGRLVTWFGTEDNKLEDICKFNYKTTWKQLDAKIEDIQSQEDDNKLLPSIINIANKDYRSWAANTGGGNNKIFGWLASPMPGLFQAQADNAQSNIANAAHMDENKVWTPRNTIQSTHIYEGKIEFNQSFTLNFNYELRSYDGINPKSAFLDLLGNILEVTHNRGKFWGGARRWIGAPRNKQGWQKANELFDKLQNVGDDAIGALFGCNSLDELGSLCKDAISAIGAGISGMWQKATDLLNDPERLKNMGENIAKTGLSIGQGMLKNKLGRPAVYAMNSLLTGDDVGLWHVTIGNPRNPIMTIGNLIIENSEIQQYGVLGIDDFPVGLKVSITLKHAKPRDITDIASMYTCGQGGILLQLNERDWRTYFDIDKNMGDLGFGGLTPDMINGADKDKLNDNGTLKDTGKVPDESMIQTTWKNEA